MLINDDTRNIKLTLSVPCYRRLKSDCSICGISLSRLIETILCDFCVWSGKIGEVQEKERLGRMYRLIADGGEIRFFKSIVRLLTDSGRRHSFPESTQYNWTVTASARAALCADDLTANETYNFISDILEEYSEMNYSSREKIMLRDKIVKIETAIKHSFVIEYSTRGGSRKEMTPYKIITEPDLQYNYLVGSVCGENGEEATRCARIFSMNDIDVLRIKKKADAGEIEQFIADRNIAYLWGEEKDIEIALTDEGENIFNLVIHNRPHCIEKSAAVTDGRRVYRFRCTEYQAAVYFRSFGIDAKVLSPASLRDSLSSFYSKALSQY